MATAIKTPPPLEGEPCWIGIRSAIEMTKAAAGPSSTGYAIGTFLQAMRSGMVGFAGAGKERRQDGEFWQNAALENVFDEQGKFVDVLVAHTSPEPDTDENAGSSWRRAHTVTSIGTVIDRDDLTDWLRRHLRYEGRAIAVDHSFRASERPDPSVLKEQLKDMIAEIVVADADGRSERVNVDGKNAGEIEALSLRQKKMREKREDSLNSCGKEGVVRRLIRANPKIATLDVIKNCWSELFGFIENAGGRSGIGRKPQEFQLAIVLAARERIRSKLNPPNF